MLDRRLLRNKFDEITKKLKKRGEDLSALANFGELDAHRRKIIAKVEELKARRNDTSKQISLLKREKQDASELIKEMRSEEHTSELQSRGHLVCRLLLAKKTNT